MKATTSVWFKAALVAATLAASAAQAGDVSWTVTVGSQPRVIYTPPPVVYTPVPVVVRPVPVVYSQAPVYFVPPGHAKHWNKHGGKKAYKHGYYHGYRDGRDDD